MGHSPIPALPPYAVRTLHFHGGPATEDTTRTGACAALALILRGASSPQDPEAAPEQPRGPQMSPGHRAVRSRSCSKPAAKRPSKSSFGCPGHRAVRSRSCSKPCLDTTFQEMLGTPPKPAQNHPGMPDSSPPGKSAPSQHTVLILLSPRGPKPAQNHPGMPESSPPRGTPHRSIPS